MNCIENAFENVANHGVRAVRSAKSTVMPALGFKPVPFEKRLASHLARVRLFMILVHAHGYLTSWPDCMRYD